MTESISVAHALGIVGRRLDIRISDTERRKGNEMIGEGHMVYHVVAKALEPIAGFPSGEVFVWRRFNDFDGLRNYLSANHPTIVIPPMPPKKQNVTWKGTDNFDPEYIEKRRAGLQTFLRRIAAHAELGEDTSFLSFLKDDAWTPMPVTDKYDDKLKSINASLTLKDEDSRFVDVRNYAANLQENIGSLVRVQERLSKHVLDHYQELGNLGKPFSSWSEQEKEMGDTLQSTGHFMDNMALSAQEKVKDEEANFTDNMRDYIAFGDSLKVLVHKHDLCNLDRQKAADALASKTAALEAARSDGEGGASAGGFRGFKSMFSKESPDQRDERIRQLEEGVEQARLADEQAKKDYEKFVTSALEEVAIFNRNKVCDFKAIMLHHAKQQAHFYRKSLSAWENLKQVYEKIP
eukprot:Opistho-2@3922